MKTLIERNKFLILVVSISLLAILTGSKIYAQCQAGFTWSQSASNTIVFTNTSTGASNPTYYWHFGDGNNGHNTNPTNYYAAPGTYWVCITLYENGHACNTFCDSITVTGTHHCYVVISPTVVHATCASCADGSIGLSLSGGTAPFAFNWSTGDTTHSIGGVLPGTYSVCVTDANNCVACDTIHVGNHHNNSCSANFSIHSDTTYRAVNMSTGTLPLSYLWTWGDGSSDTIAHPGHGYSSSGFYTICLYITDANGCTDSMCISHQFNSISPASPTISINVINGLATGINDQVAPTSFGVYLNPVFDILDIQLSINADANISIANVLGQQIFSHQISSSLDKFQINTSGWNRGLYFIQLKTQNKLFTNKFIKQ